MVHQVFISFRSSEKEVARRIKLRLERAGHTVWWQEALQCGQEWHGEIDKALAQSKCVVVLWSEASIRSPWVQHEASQAIARGIYAPARIDAVAIPSPFDRIQAAPLFNWLHDDTSPDLDLLLRRVRELLPSPSMRLWRNLSRNRWNLTGMALAAVALTYLSSVNRSLSSQLDEIRTNSQRMAATEERLEKVTESVAGAEATLRQVTSDVRDSLEPELRFVYTKTVGVDKSAYLRVENVGTGIARVTAVEARLDRVPIDTDAATLSRVGACVGFAGYDVKPGERVAPGKPLTIFEMPAQRVDNSAAADLERQRFFDSLAFVIHYESIFGKPKMLSLDYQGPRALSARAGCWARALRALPAPGAKAAR